MPTRSNNIFRTKKSYWYKTYLLFKKIRVEYTLLDIITQGGALGKKTNHAIFTNITYSHHLDGENECFIRRNED